MIQRFLPFLCCIVLFSCEPPQTLDEVEFENAKFGLAYIPDRSLEGYNEKYHTFFQPSGSPDRKYFLNPDDGFHFNNFPKNPSLLKGLEVVVIDTVARTYEKYDRTVALSTLYIDPKVIDHSSWQSLTRFITKSYSNPDSSNQLLKWLNHGYNIGRKEGDSLFVFNTIYALVYTNLDAIEPEYTSADGKRSLRVGVDEAIYYKDSTEERPVWAYTGHLTDSVFHCYSNHSELLPSFKEFARKGVRFGSLYKKEQVEN